MSLPLDLLRQSRLLAKHDRKRPTQANLRRAVSAAYYALFHLLIDDAVTRLTASQPALRSAVSRAFTHQTMKDACKAIADPQGKLAVLCTGVGGVPPQLLNVAKTFTDLQEARHRADYDTSATFTRGDVLALVSLAEQAFVDWNSIRKGEAAAVFAIGLLEVKGMRT